MADTDIKIDPKNMEDIVSMWNSFTLLLKRCSIVLAVVLILMAVFLV